MVDESARAAEHRRPVARAPHLDCIVTARRFPPHEQPISGKFFV